MNQKNKLVFSFLVMISQTAFALSDQALDEMSFIPESVQNPKPAEVKTQKRKDLKFNSSCSPGLDITLSAVGDVLLHSPLQMQAVASPKRFISLWDEVVPMFQKADISYANFEGPSADNVISSGKPVKDVGFKFDKVVYTSYPMFNYHPYLIEDLKKSGVDIVSTANNHSLDRRILGVDRTIKNLKKFKMAYVGTFLNDSTQNQIYTITETKGIKLAWIACTFSTNGIPDTKSQVLGCYEDTELIEETISTIKSKNIADAVIITPHWGVEYSPKPEQAEKKLARRFLDSGALAIIGSHPHVLQPIEKYITNDKRETFIIYSLGNFVSGQKQLERRSTILLYLGLTKTIDGEVLINGYKYIPLEMKWGAKISLSKPSVESLNHTVSILGENGRIGPDEKVNTKEHCQ